MPPKPNRGNAYITTLAAILLIITLATLALSITAVSRRLSARYSDYIGLYNLATSGNEQALFILQQSIETNITNINTRAWERFITRDDITFQLVNGNLHLSDQSRDDLKHIFIEESTPNLRAALNQNFSRYFFMYQRTWELSTSIHTSNQAITDSYSATTTICAASTRFHLDTVIYRYINNNPSTNAIVEASINWTRTGYREIILDAYTIYTLESNGVEIPDLNGENMILFLDEFALQMVESIRLQSSNHAERRKLWGC